MARGRWRWCYRPTIHSRVFRCIVWWRIRHPQGAIRIMSEGWEVKVFIELQFSSPLCYIRNTHTHMAHKPLTQLKWKKYILQSIIILQHIIFYFEKRTAVDHCSISIISFDYPFRRPFLIHWANIFFVSPQPQLYSSLEGSQTLREKTILSPALDHTFLSHLFYYWVASLFSYWYSRQSVSIVIRRAVSFSSLLSASIALSFSRPFI